MYEFHGWATIHESFRSIDEGHIESIVKELQDHISQKEWFLARAELFWANGTPLFTISGCRNHKSSVHPLVMETFILISKLAPGSYGTLFIYDDEEPGYQNEFQVFVLANGTFERVKDNMLSPVARYVFEDFGDDEI